MGLNAKTAAIVFGAVLILVGILGFIPNPLVSADGFFAVNPSHNVINIASGIILLLGAYTEFGSGMALKVIGIFYGIVAIVGLIVGGDAVLWVIHANAADHWLHVGLAILILAAGILLPDPHAHPTEAHSPQS